MPVPSVSSWRRCSVLGLPGRFRALLHLGLTDALRTLHPDDRLYTYWDYGPAFEQNRGLRIDHILLSPELAERLSACTVDTMPRTEDQPSDHTPVLCDLADPPP